MDFLLLIGLLSYYKHKNVLSEETKKTCGTLFSEYTLKRNWATWSILVFLTRRVLSILILVLGASHPLFQIGGFFFMNAAAMAWQIIVRPEKSWIGFINCMGSESIILVINALMVRVSMPNTGEEELENLGLAVVALMITCCLWNYGCWLVYTIVGIYRKIKKVNNPPVEPNKKKVDDDYSPPKEKGKEENNEKYKEDTKSVTIPGVSGMNSMLPILDHSASMEKDRPESLISVVEEFRAEDQEIRKVRSQEDKEEEQKKTKKGKKGKKGHRRTKKPQKEQRIAVIQPTSFFRDEPSSMGSANASAREEKLEDL